MNNGRGTSLQNDLLAALLTVVTNPDLVARNIKELQANIGDHEGAADAAAQALKEANDRHAAAAVRESAVTASEQALDPLKADLEARRNRLDSWNTQLGEREAAADKRDKDHAAMVASVQAKIDGISAELDKTRLAQDDRERKLLVTQEEIGKALEDLRDRETAAQALIDQYQAKLDALKRLAQ